MNAIRLARCLARSVSLLAQAAGLAKPVSVRAQAASAAPAANDGEILVTGILASLDRSIDIKRSSNGVVDAISA